MNKILIVTLFFLSAIACSVSKPLSDKELTELGEKWFGGEVTLLRNPSDTYALIMAKQEKSMEMPVNALEFGIVDLKTHKLIYKETLNDGNVSWQDDVTVRVNNNAGMASKDSSQNERMSNYTINVRTLEKDQSTK